MNELFLSVLASALVGGAWLTLSTFIIDRIGGQLGGFFAGIPSTVLLGYIFIAIFNGIDNIEQATDLFFLIFSGCMVFSLVYLENIQRGFIKAIALATLSWSVLSAFSVISGGFGFYVNCLIGFAITVFCLSKMHKFINTDSNKSKKIPFKVSNLIIRAVIGGVLIGLITLLAKTGGPILGGMMAAFPAMILATLIVVKHAHSVSATVQTLPSMLFAAGFNVNLYVLTVRYAYPAYGIIFGTILAIVVTSLSVWIVYRFFLPKYIS